MEESSLFDYWFALCFAVVFICWFPAYVIKTKGKGLPSWGLSFCIVAVFLFLPILAVSFVRDIAPAFFLSHTAEMWQSPNAILIASTGRGATTLNHVYISLALMCVVVGIGQAFFSASLLYVRHNRESLVRAIRIMWCSGFMQVLAAGILPLMILQSSGIPIVIHSAPALGLYIGVLICVTAYLHLSPAVAKFYSPDHHHSEENKEKK